MRCACDRTRTSSRCTTTSEECGGGVARTHAGPRACASQARPRRRQRGASPAHVSGSNLRRLGPAVVSRAPARRTSGGIAVPSPEPAPLRPADPSDVSWANVRPRQLCAAWPLACRGRGHHPPPVSPTPDHDRGQVSRVDRVGREGAVPRLPTRATPSPSSLGGTPGCPTASSHRHGPARRDGPAGNGARASGRWPGHRHRGGPVPRRAGSTGPSTPPSRARGRCDRPPSGACGGVGSPPAGTPVVCGSVIGAAVTIGLVDRLRPRRGTGLATCGPSWRRPGTAQRSLRSPSHRR